METGKISQTTIEKWVHYVRHYYRKMKRYQRDHQTRRQIYNAMAIINNEQTTHKVYTNQNIEKRDWATQTQHKWCNLNMCVITV